MIAAVGDYWTYNIVERYLPANEAEGRIENESTYEDEGGNDSEDRNDIEDSDDDDSNDQEFSIFRAGEWQPIQRYGSKRSAIMEKFTVDWVRTHFVT